jgi:hypothetical protein
MASICRRVEIKTLVFEPDKYSRNISFSQEEITPKVLYKLRYNEEVI